jgi:hypothetical protein
MVYEGLDPGDETRRFGDYVAFDHPDGAGTLLSNVSIDRGRVVAFDGTDLAEVTGDSTDEVTGVLANYEVSGDTGQEVVDAEANVKMRGEVLADLTVYVNGTATVGEGEALGPHGEVYVSEEVDASNNIYRVQVR